MVQANYDFAVGGKFAVGFGATETFDLKLLTLSIGCKFWFFCWPCCQHSGGALPQA